MIIRLRKSLSFIPLGILFLSLTPDAANLTPPLGRMKAFPARTLWVWERHEDLRTIDPRTTAVAVLDRTIVLGRSATVIPRRQSFVYPAGIMHIAVVRIEAPGTIGPGLEEPTADLLLAAADPTVAALQVDFDARLSQRAFYAAVLRDLRRRMPPDLPLSITALASWCSSDDWLAGLPIDEAVPMFFRMEPDRRYAPLYFPQFRIREPLCSGTFCKLIPEGGNTGGRIHVYRTLALSRIGQRDKSPCLLFGAHDYSKGDKVLLVGVGVRKSPAQAAETRARVHSTATL